MVKKLISIATAFLMLFCMIPFAAFAETVVCPKCGEFTLTTNQDISVSVGEQIGLPLSLKRAYCSNCHYAKYEYNILGIAGEQAYDDGDELHIINFLKNLKSELLGKNATATKAPSGIGRKDLPGYNNYDTGSPAINPDGTYRGDFAMIYDGFCTPFGNSFTKFSIKGAVSCDNGSFKDYGNGNVSSYVYLDTGSNVTTSNDVLLAYYFQAPVTGYYDITIPPAVFSTKSKSYDGSDVTDSFRTYISLCVDSGTGNNNIYYYRASNANSYQWYFRNIDSHSHSFYVIKGYYIKCLYHVYLSTDLSSTGTVWNDLSLQLSAPTIVCRSYADASGNKLSNQTNITINKNTWNGNIYVDNSTNLTYIYPQYTTINEKNETVTNISNTPIIYNNETKQYYTYDTVTNNYYYITYEQQPATPTPSPSPSPSPAPKETPAPSESPTLTPAPGTTPTPTPKPGGSISTPETGKPGSSSGSGQSWWDKLLSKIGDAIIDGLLGAISAVLKLIFKLFSTILGWIIWLVSQVLTLFPFLPPGLGALLIGGVVVCFVIGIIKFIRG